MEKSLTVVFFIFQFIVTNRGIFICREGCVGNKFFTPSQFSFLPGDKYIAWLLLVIHEIQTNFDSSPPFDVRGVFLDISKAFDKVWHKQLLYKLKMSWRWVIIFIGMLPSRSKTKGCFKWSKFRLEENKFWCATGVSIRFPFVLDIYKWLTR